MQEAGLEQWVATVIHKAQVYNQHYIPVQSSALVWTKPCKNIIITFEVQTQMTQDELITRLHFDSTRFAAEEGFEFSTFFVVRL